MMRKIHAIFDAMNIEDKEYRFQQVRDIYSEDTDSIQQRGPAGESVVFNAVSWNDPTLVCWLLRNGASADGSGRDYDPPLCHAVRFSGVDSLEMVHILLAAGADIEIQGLDGTPLHTAVKCRDYEKAELLLKLGANVDCLTLADGETPLWLASFHGDAHLCRLLLSYGADKTRRDHALGMTPLEISQHIQDSTLRTEVSTALGE